MVNSFASQCFVLSMRIFDFPTAVASCSAIASPLSIIYVYTFAVGARFPITQDLLIAVGLSSFISAFGHGSQFGMLGKIGIPAWFHNLRRLSQAIAWKSGKVSLREGLTLSEKKVILADLLRLPQSNARAAMFWVTWLMAGVFSYAYLNGFPKNYLPLLVLSGLLAFFMHAVFSYVLVELAIAGIVRTCRESIMADEPAYIAKSSASILTKFLLIIGTFISALLNLATVIFISHEDLANIAFVLIYNIGVASFLVYLVVYRIISSLKEIRLTATNLRAGSGLLTYSKALDAEFSDIADGLNSATISIQDHQENLEKRIEERTHQLSTERDKSESLLLNILPASVATELKEHGAAQPVHFDSVTVLFTDFVGFTKIAEQLTPTELVGELDKCFSYFDNVAQKYGLEKLKTIGDAYMAAGGIPVKNSTHPFDCALAALEIQAFMNQMKTIKEQQGFPYWELRLGMHTGPLVAGVVGEKKFAYDVWGDTVNTASRMESSGVPGAINISRELRDQLRFLFQCEFRGNVYAKNKGEIEMFFLKGIKPKFSVAGEGRVPNGEFKIVYEKLRAGAKLIPKGT